MQGRKEVSIPYRKTIYDYLFIIAINHALVSIPYRKTIYIEGDNKVTVVYMFQFLIGRLYTGEGKQL